MKTIAIPISEGIEGKNILRTPIASTLLEDKEVRLLLIVKNEERKKYYEQFRNIRILVTLVPSYLPSPVDIFFDRFRFYFLHTDTTTLRARMLAEGKNRFIFFYPKVFLHFVCSRPLIRGALRFADSVLVSTSRFKNLLDEYSIDLVLCGQLFDPMEMTLLREAKQRGIPTVGFINSWDKVTARSGLRILPKHFIVFNSIIRDELHIFHGVRKETIFVGGIPQYDYFFDAGVVSNIAKVLSEPTPSGLSRQDFLMQSGFDVDDRFILYAPMGAGYSTTDWQIIDLLHSLESSLGIKMFVRFPPNDFAETDELKKRPFLRYALPGFRFSSKRGPDWDMSLSDICSLRDTLRYADMVICYASSISVDAALFDKPIINLNFEMGGRTPMIKSPTRFYGMYHYKKALKTGAFRLVDSVEELKEAIEAYRKNSSLEKREREVVVKEQCEFTDGRSGQRIANEIVRLVQSKSRPN